MSKVNGNEILELRKKVFSKIDDVGQSGIYEVEYRLPALNNKGEIISGQYKNIPNPKTVFDPSKISNEDILE